MQGERLVDPDTRCSVAGRGVMSCVFGIMHVFQWCGHFGEKDPALPQKTESVYTHTQWFLVVISLRVKSSSVRTYNGRHSWSE